MRDKSKIMEEIVELSAIISAYNHYLASWRGLTEVENATQVNANLKNVSMTIRSLYSELAWANSVSAPRQQARRQAIVFHSTAEQNAILHFNRDKRFKINE